jgi:hypothetical protein
LIEPIKSVHDVWAILPKRHLKLPRVLRGRVPTPLDQVLVVALASTTR